MNIPSDDEMRVMIGEACGWTHEPERDFAYPWFNPPGFRYSTQKAHHSLPDWLNDLNSCAEFERTLTHEECVIYYWKLENCHSADCEERGGQEDTYPAQDFWFHATARQRCLEEHPDSLIGVRLKE